MSPRSAATLLLATVLASCHVRDSSVGEFRGVGRGWQVRWKIRPAPALTTGQSVRVLANAGECKPIGYVTGSIVRRGIRTADMDHAQLAASLDRNAAIAEARNLTGANGGDAVTIDAHETVETGREVVLLVHGRAFRCAQ